jgi:hypothetical protein
MDIGVKIEKGGKAEGRKGGKGELKKIISIRDSHAPPDPLPPIQGALKKILSIRHNHVTKNCLSCQEDPFYPLYPLNGGTY